MLGEPAAKSSDLGGTLMPRQSEASLSIAHLAPPLRRFEPPPELEPEAAAAFRATVAAVPATHFAPEDLPLLAEYARITVLTQRASAELAAAPIVDGRPTPWLEIYRTAHKAMLSLSVRLRLGARSRSPNQRSAKPGVSEPSYYELMGRERADDQD
jgi:hypothetical protein